MSIKFFIALITLMLVLTSLSLERDLTIYYGNNAQEFAWYADVATPPPRVNESYRLTIN